MASSGSDKLVVAVLADWRMAPISEKMRSTLSFLEKLTTAPAEVGPADLEPARSAGVSDQAIEEALYVCFLFSVMDRLADALDFDLDGVARAHRKSRIANDICTDGHLPCEDQRFKPRARQIGASDRQHTIQPLRSFVALDRYLLEFTARHD